MNAAFSSSAVGSSLLGLSHNNNHFHSEFVIVALVGLLTSRYPKVVGWLQSHYNLLRW